MSQMREFYGSILGFAFHREISSNWIEYRVGSNILALADYADKIKDQMLPVGNMSLQLAFRVAPDDVAACAKVLKERRVNIVSGPTDQPFGHRTLFFRDPDGNLLEIYAEISAAGSAS
jgi:catechol 2,3-dioxygenase-like lactoylglutathione lyase family enzyme